jgi:hypothetical protein
MEQSQTDNYYQTKRTDRQRATGKKLKTLFSSMGIEEDKVYRTRYHAFVTNQTLPAIEV